MLPPYIPLLSDKELEELGFKTIGDRVALRERCHEANRGSYILAIFQYHRFYVCNKIGNKVSSDESVFSDDDNNEI